MSWSGILGFSLLCLLTFIPARNSDVLLRVVSEFNTESAANKRDSRTLSTDQQLYDSGNSFIRMCSAVNRVQRGGQGASDMANARACESYVAGVADGVAVQHIWSRSQGDQTVAAFCVQFENTQAARLVDAVLQYLRENPERRRFRAAIAVEEVLHKKFPCK